MRVDGLAGELNVRHPTASVIVRNLTQLGLVEASRDGPERRSVQLRITTQGRAVLRRTPEPYAGVLPHALQTLDAGTLDRLEQGLSELIGLLDADLRAAKTPMSD